MGIITWIPYVNCQRTVDELLQPLPLLLVQLQVSLAVGDLVLGSVPLAMAEVPHQEINEELKSSDLGMADRDVVGEVGGGDGQAADSLPGLVVVFLLGHFSSLWISECQSKVGDLLHRPGYLESLLNRL